MKTDLTELSSKHLRKAEAKYAVQQARQSAAHLQNSPAEVETTCVHEAGHIAICEILGVPVNGFSGPGVSVYYDGDEEQLSSHMAAVTHDNTTRWGTVNPFVALKQNSLICVAGRAAEFVVLGVKHPHDRNYYDDSSDQGIYDESHNGEHGLPNLHLSKKELDRKWKEDFQTVVNLLNVSDARHVLDEAITRFRRFLTTDVHIDLSAIQPRHRRSREVTKKITELTNELMGPNAALDKMLRYSAARAVMFGNLGIKTKFKGPSIRYKGVCNVHELTGVVGGLTVPSDWTERLMRPLTGATPAVRHEMLVRIAGVMLIGNAYVYGDADKGYGRSNVGESNYTLANKIVKLFSKYDDEVKTTLAKFDSKKGWSNGLWKQRRKFEESLVNPLREAANSLVREEKVKKTIAAKVQEFERLISR